MTDEEYQQLEAETAAAWESFEKATNARNAAMNVWYPMRKQLDHAQLRRAMIAEIAAEKGQS